MAVLLNQISTSMLSQDVVMPTADVWSVLAIQVLASSSSQDAMITLTADAHELTGPYLTWPGHLRLVKIRQLYVRTARYCPSCPAVPRPKPAVKKHERCR